MKWLEDLLEFQHLRVSKTTFWLCVLGLFALAFALPLLIFSLPL